MKDYFKTKNNEIYHTNVPSNRDECENMPLTLSYFLFFFTTVFMKLLINGCSGT